MILSLHCNALCRQDLPAEQQDQDPNVEQNPSSPRTLDRMFLWGWVSNEYHYQYECFLETFFWYHKESWLMTWWSLRFPNSIRITGPKHISDNLLRASVEKMEWLQT